MKTKILLKYFYIFILPVLLGFSPSRMFAQAITNFPYSEGFEASLTLPDDWTQEFVFNDMNWEIQENNGAKYAVFSNSRFDPDTTKLITPALDLTSLNSPVLKFWHKQEDWESDQDELRIYYKSSAVGDWVLLAEYTKNIPEWTEELVVLPNPSNDYYIAFEGTAKYGYGVMLDNIRISEALAIDAAIVSLIAPVKGGSSEANVTIKIQNYGSDAITSMPVSYKLNDHVEVTETFTGNLALGDTIRFSFNTSVNLSEYGDYRLKVYTQLNDDIDQNNDTAYISFIHRESIPLYGYNSRSGNPGFISLMTGNPEVVETLNGYTNEGATVRAGAYGVNELYVFTGEYDVPASSFVRLNNEWETIASVPEVEMPSGMAYDHSTHTMYALIFNDDENFNLCTIDLTTGVHTVIAAISESIESLTCDLNGNLYGTAFISEKECDGLYSINKTTGAITLIGLINYSYISALAFDHHSGRLFGLTVEANELVEIDPKTGAGAMLGQIGGVDSYMEINFLYTPFQSTDGVTLNKSLLPLAIGSSETLIASVSPAGASNQMVAWSSSNTNIAVVDDMGKVTAKAEGTATITVTAKDGGYTATCTVEVKKDEILIQGHLDKDKLFKSTMARPVAHATVVLYGKSKTKLTSADPRDEYPHKIAETQTDDNGDFSFNVARGDYLVWIEMPGFTMTAPVAVIAENNSISVFNVDYFLDDDNKSISGIVNTTSASQPEAGNITIYPNPATDIIHINTGNNNPYTIQIYNTLGQLVVSTNGVSPETILNVNHLPSGIYILKIEVGNKKETKRFVKN